MPRLILLFAVMLLLGGCNWFDNGQASPPPRNQIRVKESTQQTQTSPNRTAVADRLEMLAESIPQVRNATCVVFGKTAVVGIDVQGNLDRSRVGTIKYSVAQALQKDPYGANALVTADIDLNHRLAELRDKLRKGEPIAGFADEMSDIIGRIMPQFPHDVAPPAKPPANVDERSRLKNRSL
ncbi:MAG TPA: YhcN/YlaJ family sporulation lipoprotein [Bacilli bacterium]